MDNTTGQLLHGFMASTAASFVVGGPQGGTTLFFFVVEGVYTYHTAIYTLNNKNKKGRSSPLGATHKNKCCSSCRKDAAVADVVIQIIYVICTVYICI